MSFEGYEQHFCENGHFFTVGLEPFGHFADEPEIICSFCGKKPVLSNTVDDTNGESIGILTEETLKSLEVSPQKTEVCNLGYSHVVQQATYRIPSKEEFEELQSYWDYDDEKYYSLSDYEKNWEEKMKNE